MELGLHCAGVRYMFVGKALEQRSSYRVLGVLLFVQLALSAGASAATLLMRSFANGNDQALSAACSSSTGDSSGSVQTSRQSRTQRIVLLDVSDCLLASRCCVGDTGMAWLFELRTVTGSGAARAG